MIIYEYDVVVPEVVEEEEVEEEESTCCPVLDIQAELQLFKEEILAEMRRVIG
jgi:hypothetical protein